MIILPAATIWTLRKHDISSTMYELGRYFRGLLRGLILLLAFASFEGTGVESMRTQPTEEMPFQNKIFSDQWEEEFHGYDLGCKMGRATYTWRGCGLGSNINSEIL